ncbi:PD-(D/E)XK nuclease family protein [Calothrix sp. 336/3]|uniref:PD-(D/E)XK nuclease family protein n=1 Tax=Calothrix sp. 336/3 TaxID=1337936 RepID=UPI0004E3607E|nr:PD-(D/E)XK nuclease family protein [Calothrix sp. 336/3]AKG20324.1 DNA/RNA helicase [Calothrix sp. 336/3]
MVVFRLSQGQLNLLQRCPRNFQHIYLEQLYSPANPEYEEKQTLGSRFHLLMQQREMGLPIDTLVQADPRLNQWMTAFANAAPEIILPNSLGETFRESEHYRTLQLDNYLLSVVYDLIIADNQTAQIFDWKTYSKPPHKKELEKNWQTRLYMYVLAETSEYQPEDISLTYWFVQSSGKPQSVKFTYSPTEHQLTAKNLEKLLSQLGVWLHKYEQGESFPQIPEGSKICQQCNFVKSCFPSSLGLETYQHHPSLENSPNLESMDSHLMDIDAIQEVIIN